MIFIALQCCQCSTMQVKQQKKSSNKWTCVVCNQKQSVRKVFAQGSMARDVRSFVQSFNLSRKVADERLHTVEEEEEQQQAIVDDRNQTKKRKDWTEYLDIEDDVNEEGEDEVTVTELPREMFKKPKLRGGLAGSSGGEGAGLFKPVFSKRNFNKQVVSQGLERTPTIASKEPKKEVKRVSKWNQYIVQEQDEDLGSRYTSDQWGNEDVLETVPTNDQMVEEHIHPDFL